MQNPTKILEIRNITNKIKNAVEGMKSIIDKAKEIISEL
jgi:hypothetical protein